MLIILVSIVLNCVLALVSAVSQLDLRLGSKDFFIGEKFLITLTDLIYGLFSFIFGIVMAGMYLTVREYMAAKRKIDEDIKSQREERLIGSNKYPTHVEERVLKAIHTDPSNYFEDSEQNYRQGRLIGSKKYPTHIEERMLTPVNTELDNSFESENYRQGRLIGSRKYPTHMEDRLLKPVDDDIDNSF